MRGPKLPLSSESKVYDYLRLSEMCRRVTRDEELDFERVPLMMSFAGWDRGPHYHSHGRE